MSAPDLTGRRAVVTGAAHRTGRALALALAEAGADVAVHYRSSEAAAAQVVAEIESLGRRSVAVPADLRDPEQAERAMADVVAAFGGLDILVNNVGTIVWKDLPELTPREWQDSLDGTLGVTYQACRAALPHLRASRAGRIVNLLDADADALAPVVHATPYKIGKAGSWILTKTLAKTEGAYGVTVNAVSPGVLDDSEKAVPLERIPLGRVGTYADVASAVLFFASEASGYVTGSNLKVSGGYLV